MGFSSNDMLTPLLYRDIAGAANTPMGASMGGIYAGLGMDGLTGDLGNLGALTGSGMLGGAGNTNLLGGVTMQQGLEQDEYHSYLQRQQKDMNFLKKVTLVIGGLVVLDLLRFRGLKKLLKTKLSSTKLGKKMSGWWGKLTGAASSAAGAVTSAAGSATSAARKSGFWKKLRFWK